MLHRSELKASGFKVLAGKDLQAVAGGTDGNEIIVTGQRNDPWVQSIYLDDLLAVGMDFGDLFGDAPPDPFGDGALGDGGGSGSSDNDQSDPDGVEVTLNEDGDLEVEVTTLDGDLSAEITFDLAELDVETITVQYQGLSFEFNPDGSSAILTATSGSLTAELNFSDQFNSDFNAQEQKIEATFTIKF